MTPELDAMHRSIFEDNDRQNENDGNSADIVTTEAIITADDIDIAEDIITREGCSRVRMDISPSKISRTYVP